MLQRILAGAPRWEDPNVLVGYEQADDAGVYRWSDDAAIVQSVDFFTPVVDDPFVYGQIAAANALSDIYAMGGQPRFALSVVGFPADRLDEAVLAEIFRGGAEKMREAGVSIVGGHSVQDPEIKFGFCVTGFVHPRRFYTNAGAQPGDHLLLTKPLGTGIIATGIKFNKAPAHVVDNAVRWMRQLNSFASERFPAHSVHAITDITGNGFLGHAYEMARASQATLVVDAASVPILEGVQELAMRDMLPGGIESNRRYVGEQVAWNGLPLSSQQILLDPQTSGGLLISVPEPDASQLAQELNEAGGYALPVGRVETLGERLLKIQPLPLAPDSGKNGPR